MSLKIRIIPCLDVKDGRVVKGVKFVDLRDAGDVVMAAQAYDKAGADELCFLDITASNEKRTTLYDMVAKTADECFMPLTVGGGISELQHIRQLLLVGADKVSINSAAVADPDFIARAANKFGNQCIVASIDAKTSNATKSNYEIFTHSGTRGTGLCAVEFAKLMASKGAGEILLTSMDKDGTYSGYNLGLIRAITKAVNVPIVASGGAGKLEHLVEAVKAGADAVLAASIFHFGDITIAEAKTYMAKSGIKVRT